MQTHTFSSLQVPQFLSLTLEGMGYITPTEIQQQAIPILLKGKDVLASSQTGSGKTAAFAIPIISQIAEDATKSALILAPTRELALQIKEVFHQMRGKQKIFTATLFGGASIDRQMMELKKNPNVVIATPGRLQDHMKRRTINLANFNILVLDEFDRMLDMGFRDEIAVITSKLPKERQTMMFSATQRGSVIALAKTYLTNFEQIVIAQPKETHENIKQSFVEINDSEKYYRLLQDITEIEGQVIVFTNMKRTADEVCDMLREDNIKAQAIHGDLRQSKRESTINRFKEGKFKVLVATDVAARGIDVKNISCVINYDTPRTFEDYTHRIGRTGRGGASGTSICYVTRLEKSFHQNILKKTNSDDAQPQYGNKKPQQRRSSGFSGGRGRFYGGRGSERNGESSSFARPSRAGGFKARTSFGNKNGNRSNS